MPPALPARSFIASALRRSLLIGAVWLMLGNTDPMGLLVGAAATAAAVCLSLWLSPPSPAWRLLPLLRIVPGFLARSLWGGVDVAVRALHPRMPLRPGWISLPTTLSPAGRVTLGTLLSLMPGTLAAGSDGRRVLIHALDTRLAVKPAAERDAARLARAIPPDTQPDAEEPRGND